MISKAAFVRYVDIMVVFSAILNVIKFGLARDAAALKTLATIAAVSLSLFAGYLTFTGAPGGSGK